MDYLDLALEHAENGYPVFPARTVADGPKRPAKSPYFIEDWENQATRDPDQIIDWWEKYPDAVPAIPPGRIGCTVVDLDTHPDKVSGFDTALANDFPVEARTSGRSISGLGKHLWFRGEDYSLNEVYPGIDRKSTGGYVVVPYSLPKASSIVEQLPMVYFGGRRSGTSAIPEDAPDISAWAVAHGGDMSPQVRRFVDSFSVPFNGHQNALNAIRTLVGWGARGSKGTATGIDALEKLWMATPHASGDPAVEWAQMAVGAIQRFGKAEVLPKSVLGVGVLSTPDPESNTPVFTMPGLVGAQEILDTTFPPVEWVIPGFVPRGTSLLVANPKVGKSWLALDFALAATTPRESMGFVRCENRPTLYLAMEDYASRLQTRMKVLGATKPKNLWFGTRDSELDLVTTIRTFSDAYPNGFIIVDTLAAVKRELLKDLEPDEQHLGNAYDQEYLAFDRLRQFLPETGSLLMVHHTNKGKHDDYIQAASGTQGLTGSVDVTMLLTRDRAGTQATLKLTGRDVVEGDTDLGFQNGVYHHMDSAAAPASIGRNLLSPTPKDTPPNGYADR